MDGRATDWLSLVGRIERGDHEALARLTSLITGYLARFGAYEIRDSWSDLCQEVLIKVLRSTRDGRIGEPRAFVAYVGTITRNSLVDWHRRNSKHSETAHPDAEEPLQDSRVLAEAGLVSEPALDLRADLRVALEALPEVQRQVLTSVYVEGHSYEDAARLLGIPLGTLKRHQTQGLRALRERMQVTK